MLIQTQTLARIVCHHFICLYICIKHTWARLEKEMSFETFRYFGWSLFVSFTHVPCIQGTVNCRRKQVHEREDHRPTYWTRAISSFVYESVYIYENTKSTWLGVLSIVSAPDVRNKDLQIRTRTFSRTCLHKHRCNLVYKEILKAAEESSHSLESYVMMTARYFKSKEYSDASVYLKNACSW